MSYELYEDRHREKKQTASNKENQYSPYCDFVYYESSRQPGLQLAARIIKPAQPSYILVGTHGWHMSIPHFKVMEEPDPSELYLRVEVDMRGRAHSDGAPDCNGWELYDVIDAVNYVREHYSEFIINPDIVYFEAGSGGGGNALAIAGKFPDFFAGVTALCGISDYGLWYRDDQIGEFRDEMDIWIGGTPNNNQTAYHSRSGLYLAENLLSPLFIAHGETDIRVPVDHSRLYVERAQQLGKETLVEYMELEGVGTRSHWGNATDTQMALMEERSESNREANRGAIMLPSNGRMVVGGYLFTKQFSIVLESIDQMAIVDYDLTTDTFTVTSSQPCSYTIERFGC